MLEPLCTLYARQNGGVRKRNLPRIDVIYYLYITCSCANQNTVGGGQYQLCALNFSRGILAWKGLVVVWQGLGACKSCRTETRNSFIIKTAGNSVCRCCNISFCYCAITHHICLRSMRNVCKQYFKIVLIQSIFD